MNETWSKRIEPDQNGSSLIKLDQNGSNLIKMDQIGSNLIKLDQNGSKLMKLDLDCKIVLKMSNLPRGRATAWSCPASFLHQLPPWLGGRARIGSWGPACWPLNASFGLRLPATRPPILPFAVWPPPIRLQGTVWPSPTRERFCRHYPVKFEKII